MRILSKRTLCGSGVNYFNKAKGNQSIPIHIIEECKLNEWLLNQSTIIKNFINSCSNLKEKKVITISDVEGRISQVLHLVTTNNFSNIDLCEQLIPGNYHVESSDIDNDDLYLYYLEFALGSYKFNTYHSNGEAKKNKLSKKNTYDQVKLFLPQKYHYIKFDVEADYIARDIVYESRNISPEKVSSIVQKLATECCSDFSEVIGKDLVESGYTGIYAVGKQSDEEPRLVKLAWGNNKNSPKISIVGEGIAPFTNTSNLNSIQKTMHKNMAGIANAIALAYLIMKNNLPVSLSLSIPIVGNIKHYGSYYDNVITMGNGLTVETTNIGAEGRLILAEPLHEEAIKKPDLLIDFANPTTAISNILGPEVTAFFCNNNDIAEKLHQSGENVRDRLVRFPLAECYNKSLKSKFADIASTDGSSFAEPIKSALFLQHFLKNEDENNIQNPTDWIHFETANYPSSPSSGNEVRAVRAIFNYIKEQYLSRK